MPDPRKYAVTAGDILYVQNEGGDMYRFTVNHVGFDPSKEREMGVDASLTIRGVAEEVPEADKAEGLRRAFERGSGGISLDE
jgi:hypothetical protein